MPDNKIKQIMHVVGTLMLLGFIAYVINRLLFAYAKNQYASNPEIFHFFARTLHLFPSKLRPTTYDAPSIMVGYAITFIFVTIIFTGIRKLRKK